VPICGQKNHNGAGTWHYSYAGQRYFESATGLDAAGHFPPSHENSCYHGPNERLLSDNEAFVWALCAAGPLWLPLIMVTGAGRLLSAAVRGKAPKRAAEVRAELAAAERALERVTAEVKKLK
jgi:hypothetical protein